MMRPMKLAGSQLLFGEGCLAFLKDIDTKRAMIVTGGSSMKRSGMLDKVEGYLKEGRAPRCPYLKGWSLIPLSPPSCGAPKPCRSSSLI